MSFFQFSISENPHYLFEKHYHLEKPPYSIRFHCFQLVKFVVPEQKITTEQEEWLFWMKNDRPSKRWEKRLAPILDKENWNEDWNAWYDIREEQQTSRPKRVLKLYQQADFTLDKQFLKSPATKADWNWYLLEKMIGYLPRKQVNMTKINLDAIQSKLATIAFTLFRGWTQNYMAGNPTLNLTIVNEELLVNDLQNCLKSAILDAFLSDSFYSPEYDSSILLSAHLHGHLGKHWYMEYIIKHSAEFKTTMALKSLSAWMSLEDVSALRIDEIYEQVLKDKINLANMDFNIPKTDLLSQDGTIIEPNEGKTKVHIAIENLAHEQIGKLQTLTTQTKDFMPKVLPIVGRDILERLIEDNQKVFFNV